MKNKISKLLNGLRNNASVSGVASPEQVAGYTVSTESDGNNVHAKEAREALFADLQQVLADVSAESADGFDYAPSQLQAASIAAAMALNPKHTYLSGRTLRSPVITAGAHNLGTIGIESISVEDAFETAPALEGFDGQSLDSAVYMSFVYNFMASKQGAFAETFFPTVVIDPASSGIAVEANVINLVDEFTRASSGAPDKSKFNRRSIVKELGNGTSLSASKNRLVPVSRVAAADVLETTITFTDETSGTAITSSPIKPGVVVGLLGVSQTDEMLLKGSRDNTDSLDRRVNLTSLYYKLTGDDGASGTTTQTFKADVSGKPHMGFTFTADGHNKDLTMSYSGDAITINTVGTTQIDGSASSILTALAANHTIKLNVVLHGDGNTQDGDIVVYVSGSVTIAEIRDSAGNLVTSGAVYDAIKAVTDTITIAGYTVEAYATNSNLRQRSQLIGVDVYTQIYTVPVRTGATILKSAIGNSYDNDDDLVRLGTQISITGAAMTQDAVSTLVNWSEMLYSVTQDGSLTNIGVAGLAGHFVDAYYSGVAFNAANFVDSLSSKDRVEDIGGALTAKIRDEITKMCSSSNYLAAHEVINGPVENSKIGVVIGTDMRIAEYINEGGLNFGENFDVRVVTSYNSLVAGKIFITFVDVSATRNQKVNPLGFGFTAWAPELSIDVVSSRSGVVRELTSHPRFLHVAQLPVVSVITVTGIEDVLGKITQNVSQ